MSTLARHHRLLGWLLAVGWVAAAGGLILMIPDMQRVGEYGVFLQWAPYGLLVAVLTWIWVFGPDWRSPTALTTVLLVLGTWVVLWAVGREGRIHLAARDAFFLRRPGVALALRSVTWLYVVYPMALLTGGCLAVVEYLRHPTPWLKRRAQEAS